MDTLPIDVEKATQPIMERAQKVKEQVTQATANVKEAVEAKAQHIRSKSSKCVKRRFILIFILFSSMADRLMGISEKMLVEAREVIVEPDQQQTFRARYGIRGGKLIALLSVFVILAVICVVCKF